MKLFQNFVYNAILHESMLLITIPTFNAFELATIDIDVFRVFFVVNIELNIAKAVFKICCITRKVIYDGI